MYHVMSIHQLNREERSNIFPSIGELCLVEEKIITDDGLHLPINYIAHFADFFSGEKNWRERQYSYVEGK